jgi:adenylylsulfate kinase-like enzyme
VVQRRAGLDEAYDPPENAELRLRTDRTSVPECLRELRQLLENVMCGETSGSVRH